MAILQAKNAAGQWVEIPALRGPAGSSGARSEVITINAAQTDEAHQIRNVTTEHGSTTNSIRYYKSGSTVTLTFDIIPDSITTQVDVGTLDNGFRPPTALTTPVPIYGTDANERRYIILAADGTIYAYSRNIYSRMMGVITYGV